MSGDIVLSAGVRANLTSLQQTADLLAQTQDRLATGLKVNSALDNPIEYFTAQSLNRRATSLSNLLDSISNATQTIQAANNGITAITKLVQNAQAVAQQALQSSSTTATLNGSVSGLTASSSFSFTSGKTITVSDGTTTATFTLGATDTVQDFLDSVNNTAGLNVKAELSNTGNIVLEATGSNSITLGGTDGATEAAQLGLTLSGAGSSVAGGTVNASRTSLATQFNSLMTQIDQLAGDAGFNGINLLIGNALKIVYNENGTSSQTLNGVQATSKGLGISQVTAGFQSNKEIGDTITQLSSALTTLATDAANFGANLSVIQTRNDFTKATINTLQAGANSLTLADTNEEGANLLSLQTRQSLATNSLSLAVQSDRNVLKLFG
jgi:flagellin-like hook-associated protein FlgL